MFSCWQYCGNEDEDNMELIIKGFDKNLTDRVEQRQSRNNRSEIRNLISQAARLTMIRASKYDEYLKQCKLNGTKFTDRAFPPNSTSLNFQMGNRKIVWKRIAEVVEDPVMVEGKIEPSDIQQGNVGDCYFLASISSIAEVPERVQRIFDNKMQISREGIYKLIVCQQGQPREIVIDDYIPVFEGSNRPVFCKPYNREIWVMLLEKAWAKLSGSYGSTSSGYPHEVLNTFLVAPCMFYDISIRLIDQELEKKKELRKNLLKAHDLNLPTCAGSRSNHICQGIKPSHTYSLLGTYEVEVDGKSYCILKLRNPWGDTEYTGRHSQVDTEFWNQVHPDKKRKIFKKRNPDDGIFTLELDEFIRNFQTIDVSFDREGFNYILEKQTVHAYQPIYHELNVSEGKGEVYITAEKAFDRNLQLQEKRSDYGYVRLLLFLCDEENRSYTYIASKIEPNFPDVTLFCRSLEPGKYMLMIESSFPELQTEGNVTLSMYSENKCWVERINKPDPNVLRKIFQKYAYQHREYQQPILHEDKDWTAAKFLFEEGGFGYIAVHLSQSSKLKMRILCDIKKVNESGYRLVEVGQQNGILEINLQNQPGSNFCILIFAIDFSKSPQKLRFPPKGVKVTRIV